MDDIKARSKRRVNEIIDEIKTEMVGLSDFLHANPETSMNEYKACAEICRIMERRGFETTRKIGNLETAFKAVSAHGGGPVVAFLAEYDALPELGHACGHNLIAAMSAGAAIAVDRMLRETAMKGTVMLIGTPAEEMGGGKVKLVNAGCFEGVDCAVMVHPASSTRVEDITLASTRLVLTYAGKPAHAAAAPWYGANALEAVIQTFNQVNALRCQLHDLSRINGIITKGGTAVNIIPELAEASFGIRATNRRYLDELVEKVGECARNASASMGVSVEIVRMGQGYDAMMNNPVMEALMASNFEAMGEEVTPYSEKIGLSSSDMGNVTRVVPSAQCYIKVRDGIEPHTAGFREACVGGDAERAMLVGAKTMAMTAIDIFSEPSVLPKMRDEYRRQTEA